MYYIAAYLQDAAVPEEAPNAETIASIKELESGGGALFNGRTEELFAVLMEEYPCSMYDTPPDSKKISRPA